MLEEEFASKKKKLRPLHDEEENNEEEAYIKSLTNSKKIKITSSGKSVSKSRLNTQKKCEVTFSEEVEEIKEGEKEKENSQPVELTPFKNSSPSKQSLRSVKDHVKTPFSKIKDSQDLQSSSKKKADQPNFNSEIVDKSPLKNHKDNTPIKASSKNSNENLNEISNIIKSKSITKSKSRLRSKSPLNKIKEDINERESLVNKDGLNISMKKEKLEETCPKIDQPEHNQNSDKENDDNIYNNKVSFHIENIISLLKEPESSDKIANPEVKELTESDNIIQN
jgi:hypothetical protein